MPPKPKRNPEARKKTDREYKAEQRQKVRNAREAQKKGPVSVEQQAILDWDAKASRARRDKYREDKEHRPEYISRQRALAADRFRARLERRDKIRDSGRQSEVEEVNEQQMLANEKRRDAPWHRKWRASAKLRLEAAKELVAKPQGSSSQDPEYVAARALIQKARDQRVKATERARRARLSRQVKKPECEDATQRQLQGDEGSREDPWDSSSDDSTAPGQDDSDDNALGEFDGHSALRAREHEVEHMLGKVRLNFRQSQIYRQSYTRRQPLV